MAQPKATAELYMRFLQMAEAIRGLPTLPALDPLEERILSAVANARQTQERLSVRDMMAKHQFGSSQTIHTRLKSMRDKGWIQLADTEDTRRKQIELTLGALAHFEKLSACMVQATRSESVT